MCDVKKFLLLIKSRPAIYNSKLKTHHGTRQVENLWSEIASEMQMSVKECKGKYTSLRNAYARFLREQPGSGHAPNPKKKSWYLAPAMEFMKDHMIVRKSARNSTQPETETEDETSLSNSSQVDEFTDGSESSDYIPPSSSRRTKRSHTTTAEPTNEYSNAKIHRTEDEDANDIFFKSMLPDMKKLTDRNQRRLKQDFLLNLNTLLEEQEFMITPTRKFSAT